MKLELFIYTEHYTREYIAVLAVELKRPPVNWLSAGRYLSWIWPLSYLVTRLRMLGALLPPYVCLLCLIKHETSCLSPELLNCVEVILLNFRRRKWSWISALPSTTISPQRIIEEKGTRVLSGIKLGLKKWESDSLWVLLQRARL